jgi:RNA polymerase sigma-70 factor, ECF subfamily
MMLSRYARAVKKYVYFRLAPRADHADDVVQDVFLAAWENLGAYRGNSSLQSWLLGIARNKIKDYYRAHLREPGPLETAKEKSGAKIAPPQIDDHLDKERARIKARRVLNQLPEKYRIILIWRYWNEYPVKAIAARIGKTGKATERMLARARDEFRSVWDQQSRDSRFAGSESGAPLLFRDFGSNDARSIPPGPSNERIS